MDFLFDNERPIYIQLVEKLRIEIVSGKLRPGERILSVRELALNLKVNPNTMQKALVELENEGLVYTERTNGKFVTQNDNLIENLKKKMAEEKVNKYLEDMLDLGIDNKEALKYLKEIGGKF
ncbi:MAG: GntR family transcriptional regulator [Clostridia bacterium]|nr:GntR family transcriptional regulator [Clostridia bacterium]